MKLVNKQNVPRGKERHFMMTEGSIHKEDHKHVSSWCCLVAPSCLALCNLMNCSPPGSSVHGILQAKILERVAMPSSRGSSQPRDWILLQGRHILYRVSHHMYIYMCVCVHTYTWIYIFFFRFFSLLGYHKVLSRVPCALQ